MEAKRTHFLWLLVTIHIFSVVAVVASLSGFYSDNGFDQTIMHKELSHRAKREVQQEILHLLGLHHRPRPNFNSAHGTVNPAPRFLLDVYRSFTEEDSGGLKLEPKLFENEFNISRNDVLAIDQSDLIMSFVNHGHQLRHHHRESVFWFDLSEIARNTFPLNAELRVYLKHLDAQSAIYDNLSGIVLRVHRFLSEDRDVVEEEMSMDQLNEGWVALNVTKALQSWMVSPEANKGLRLTAHHVSDGEINVQDVGIVGSKGEEDLQPFMVGYFRVQKTAQDAEEEDNKPDWTEFLNLQQQEENVVDDEEDEPRRLPSRRRRAANGTGNNKRRNGNKDVSYADDTTAWNPYSDFDPRYARRSCQKKNLYVSFRDLGWHDWIIAPDGYAAFYCNGECSFPLNAHMNASNHAIVQTLVHLMNPYQYPKPCCAPIKLSSISVLYFDDTSNVILKKYRNMVVKSCGCH